MNTWLQKYLSLVYEKRGNRNSVSNWNVYAWFKNNHPFHQLDHKEKDKITKEVKFKLLGQYLSDSQGKFSQHLQATTPDIISNSSPNTLNRHRDIVASNNQNCDDSFSSCGHSNGKQSICYRKATERLRDCSLKPPWKPRMRWYKQHTISHFSKGSKLVSGLTLDRCR